MAEVTRASYAVLIACTLAHFLNHVYTGVLSPLFPALNGLNGIQDDLSLSFTEIGIITSAAIIMMTLFHLVIGYLGDKGWRDFFIPLSVFAPSLVVLVTGFATGFYFLVATQILLGLGVSPLHPSMFPALSERFPKYARARAVGVIAAGGLVGMVLVPFLASTLFALLSSWRQSLFILGLMGIVLFVPALLFMKYAHSFDIRIVENEVDAPKAQVVIDGPSGWSRNYILLILYVALRGVPFRCTTLLMPTYLSLRYGHDALLAGTLTSIMLAAGLVAEFVFAPVSDRVGKRTPFMIASMALLVPSLMLLNLPLDLTTLIIVLILVGFVYFIGIPAGQAYETEVVPAKSKGLAFGVLFSLGALPGALSPWFFGFIGDTYGLDASIIFLVITAILGTVIALTLRESAREPEKVPLVFDTPLM